MPGCNYSGEISKLFNIDSGDTLWKLRKFILTLFWQKFRETNVFTKEITKELI